MKRWLAAAILLFSLVNDARADDQVFAARTVQSTRFPDADVAGPEIVAGTPLVVLFRLDDRVRVQAGSRFGWIPADAVADEPPAAETDEP